MCDYDRNLYKAEGAMIDALDAASDSGDESELPYYEADALKAVKQALAHAEYIFETCRDTAVATTKMTADEFGALMDALYRVQIRVADLL